MPKQAALFYDCASSNGDVFGQGRRERLAQLTDLDPHVVTTRNFEDHVDGQGVRGVGVRRTADVPGDPRGVGDHGVKPGSHGQSSPTSHASSAGQIFPRNTPRPRCSRIALVGQRQRVLVGAVGPVSERSRRPHRDVQRIAHPGRISPCGAPGIGELVRYAAVAIRIG